jgi:hypothetical protein
MRSQIRRLVHVAPDAGVADLDEGAVVEEDGPPAHVAGHVGEGVEEPTVETDGVPPMAVVGGRQRVPGARGVGVDEQRHRRRRDEGHVAEGEDGGVGPVRHRAHPLADRGRLPGGVGVVVDEFDVESVQRGGDAAGALRDAAVEWGGGTEIGGAFTALRRDHPHAVDRRTAVVVVSDGLDVGDRDVLEDGVTWLADRAGALLWLNPLAVSPQFEPRSRGMAASEPYVDALFGFTEPADLAEAARQIERRGLAGPVGYEYDRRRRGSGGDGP